MNPFFWMIVIFVIVLFWFLMSFAFDGIGSIFYKIYKDAKDEICENKKENDENEG